MKSHDNGFDFSHLEQPRQYDFSRLEKEKGKNPIDIFGLSLESPEMYAQRKKTGSPSPPLSHEQFNEMIYQLLPFAKGMNLVKAGGETGLKALFASRKILPKNWVNAIQKGHDTLKGKAQGLFDAVKNQVGKREIPNMKLSDDLLEEAQSHLPITRASKNLIENAKNGDHESVFKLQSELGKRGFKRLSHDMPSENDVGELMLDTRDKILENMRNHFKDTGHTDLSDTMDNARSMWSNLKKTYYPTRIPQIGQMVEEGYRKVPSNIPGLLSQESVPMKNLLEAHPQISQELGTLQNAERVKNNIKNLTKIGYGVGGAASAVGVPYGLYYANKALEGSQNLKLGESQ